MKIVKRLDKIEDELRQRLLHQQTRAGMTAFYADLHSNAGLLDDVYAEPSDDADIDCGCLDIDKLQHAINAPTVAHPDWVKTGDDFVRWIRELKV